MTPEALFRHLLAYRNSAMLRTAIELDFLTAIQEKKTTAREIAAARGGTERSVRILLDALAAAAPEVLRKSGGRYALTPLSRRYLVRSSPQYVGDLLPLYGSKLMWDAFRDLPEAVRAGTSVLEKDAHAENQEFWETFARATAREAKPRARAMVRLLGRMPDPCDILDLACGSGMYGATFAKEIRGARVTLFDQANVLAQTREIVDVPVQFTEGDLFETPYGGPYDLILASHVLHHFDLRECRLLARKIAGALKPRGRLLLQEFVPDEKRARKAEQLQFAVTMLVWTRAGDAYTLGEYRKLLTEAGLRKVSLKPLIPPAEVILAVKP